MSSCRFIEGLYGFLSPAAPVFGDLTAITELEAAVLGGLFITELGDGIESEADHAIKLTQRRLQQEGVLPADVSLLDTLSDDQLAFYGFEPKSLDTLADLQHLGNPHFKTMDIAATLAHLRRLAHFNLMLGSGKPVFQLGILTMITVGGAGAQYSAQLIPVEPGIVTRTLWLYRRCAHGLDGEYEERWCAFDAPFDASLAFPMREEQVPDLTVPVPPAPNQGLVHSSSAGSRKRGREPDDQQRAYNTLTPEPNAPADTSTPPPAQKRRRNRYWGFDHGSLTDEQLLAIEPYLIQGEVILRLARTYSNGEIFARINANYPGQVKTVNVITKRLTHAIENAAQLQGRTVEDVRAEIMSAKEANGVVHKMKTDVATYSEGQRRYAKGE